MKLMHTSLLKLCSMRMYSSFSSKVASISSILCTYKVQSLFRILHFQKDDVPVQEYNASLRELHYTDTAKQLLHNSYTVNFPGRQALKSHKNNFWLQENEIYFASIFSPLLFGGAIELFIYYF